MQIDYNYFMNPANRPADIASAIVNNPSPKQRGIHSARIRQTHALPPRHRKQGVAGVRGGVDSGGGNLIYYASK